MTAPASAPSLLDLVADAQRALRLTQPGLAALTGSSVRTVQRWMQGSSRPSSAQVGRLVSALGPVDRALAVRLAELAGLSLKDVGLEAPEAVATPGATAEIAEAGRVAATEPAAGAAAEPRRVAAATEPPLELSRNATSASLVPVLVEAVIAAAAEALQLPPQRARPAVRAALERAERAGLSVGQMLEALRGEG